MTEQPEEVQTSLIYVGDNASKNPRSMSEKNMFTNKYASEKNRIQNRLQSQINMHYNPQTNVIYKKLANESQKNDMIKRIAIFENSNQKPYQLLNSKQLDRIIYFHQKYLENSRQQKINRKKKSDDDVLREINQKYKIFDKTENEGTEEQVDENKGFFMTGVNHEKKLDDAEEEHFGEEEEQQEEDALDEGDFDEDQVRLRKLRSNSTNNNIRRKLPNLQGKTYEDLWKKRKKGPKFVLDCRKQVVHQEGRPIDPMTRLKNIHKRNHTRNVNFFIPTLKIKRNPQLEIIERYFGDCNEDFIQNIPLIKIPPILRIDKTAKVQLP